MKVKLNNSWFTGEFLYPAGVHDIPKELYDKLPSSAEVVKDTINEEKKEEVFTSLKDLDVARSVGDREQAFVRGKK